MNSNVLGKILVVANNKGGVGKTTLTLLLSIWFSRQNKRVLVIDFDSQCNLSRCLVDMEIDPANPEAKRPSIHREFGNGSPDQDGWDGRSASSDIFFGKDIWFYPTRFKNLEVLPGSGLDLLRVERVTEENVKESIYDMFIEWLDVTRLREDYDVIIIDTGPTKGPLTTAAVNSATDILIPAEMEELSVQGLFGMLAYWDGQNQRRDVDDQIRLVGILANKFNTRMGPHHYYLNQVKEHEQLGSYLLPQVMHLWQDYNVSTMKDEKTVLELGKSNKARRELEIVCKQIEERIYAG